MCISRVLFIVLLYYYWASALGYVLLCKILVLQRIVKLETEDEEKNTKGVSNEQKRSNIFFFPDKDDVLSLQILCSAIELLHILMSSD